MDGGVCFDCWCGFGDSEEETTGGQVDKGDGAATKSLIGAFDVEAVFEIVHVSCDFGVPVSISIDSFGLGGGAVRALGLERWRHGDIGSFGVGFLNVNVYQQRDLEAN